MDQTLGSTGESKPAFARVPLLGSEGADFATGIRDFVESAALVALVQEFAHDENFAHGERMPAGASLADRLAWLDEFSSRWDYRAGRERNLVDEEVFSAQRSELVLAAADSFGLIGRTAPPVEGYDHILILGGLVRACIARPLHAARLLEKGVASGAVTALGGYRQLAGDELQLAQSFGMQAHEDEFHVMDDGVRRAFGLCRPIAERGVNSEVVGASWRVREYRDAKGLPLSVIAAPSSEPGKRRANTADTYRWFAAEIAHLRSGQRLLVVTTSIYVPFQHANAIRMFTLPFGARVDTVGAEPGELDARLRQDFLPHHYLQEVRSTIRALRELYAALGSLGAS